MVESSQSENAILKLRHYHSKCSQKLWFSISTKINLNIVNAVDPETILINICCSIIDVISTENWYACRFLFT